MTHDELIEAVAIDVGKILISPSFDPFIHPANYNLARKIARAAIRVIAPAVLEEAAEEASIAWDAVAAIRAMKTRYEQ